MRTLAPLLPLPLVLALGAWGSARAADTGGVLLGQALASVAAVVGAEQRRVDEESDAAFDATVPVSTLATSSALDVEALGRGHGPGRGKSARSAKTAAPTLFVSADTVLRLAETSVHPRGTRVPADGPRPPGLRLSGVGSLGIGLRDGDVLTRALGRPVLSKSEVVQAVLLARARHVPVLEGEFWRGTERWVLRVEQPYLGEKRPP